MNSDTGKKNKCVYNIKTNLKNNMRLGLWSVSLRWDHGYFFYFIRGVKVLNFLNQYIIIKAFLQPPRPMLSGGAKKFYLGGPQLT